MDIRARVFTSVEVEFVVFHFALFQREDTGIFPGFLFNARVSLIYDTCFLPKPRSLCHCVDTLHIYQRSPAPPNPSGKTRTCPRDTFRDAWEARRWAGRRKPSCPGHYPNAHSDADFGGFLLNGVNLRCCRLPVQLQHLTTGRERAQLVL